MDRKQAAEILQAAADNILPELGIMFTKVDQGDGCICGTYTSGSLVRFSRRDIGLAARAGKLDGLIKSRVASAAMQQIENALDIVRKCGIKIDLDQYKFLLEDE